MRNASSVRTTPTSSSLRTTAGSTAGSVTWAVTIWPDTSGLAAATSPTTDRTSGRSLSFSGRTTSVWAPVFAFSSAGVPLAIIRPRSITTISSANWSASSRY